MKFKENAKPVSSSDLYYDLFAGGYINPDKLLEAEDAERVNNAIALVEEFLNELENNDLLEEM